MRPGTPFLLEVNPHIPPRLARLEELASNLWYSWHRPTRELFSALDHEVWNVCGHSPKAFLRRVDEAKLLEAAEDPVFLDRFNRVLSAYDTYHDEPLRRNGSEWLLPTDLVAYFCFEFGFHESLPIYSGGLGILAGDHCKAASDMRMPFVGVGLLYRQGYFTQRLDLEGRQEAIYADSDFDSLPISLARDKNGKEVRFQVELPGRHVAVRAWQARIGHVRLLLLDTDLEENGPHDRAICHRLYGGDRITRIEQEIMLGIGGVRALTALGLEPSVWHINEGHAAFQILERIRGGMARGHDFASALEAVAASTVFTTHTPVAAGHDHFDSGTMHAYFESYCREARIGMEQFYALGAMPGHADFNMTALAVRGSRFQNGVSRIHGRMSSELLKDLWPQVVPEENPIGYITNGVHIPTFLAPEWGDVFDRYIGPAWKQSLSKRAVWDRIAEVPDHLFWSVHQALKARMLYLVRNRIREQFERCHGSEAHIRRLLRLADPDNPNVLTIGFGRRFATYKRATLLFEDLDWLRRLVGDAKRPVLFIYAGKAHPADQPGQQLIARIAELAGMAEFEGKVLLVEGYDLHLARRLTCGVDVWMNTPVYPLEASGTSGMKAGANGVINLSVLDGWWGEGYEGDNGWAITPASDRTEPNTRNLEESRALYETLQDHVVPLYYDRSTLGYSPGWVAMAKRSMASILPRYSATRMLSEYLPRFYLPASRQGRRLADPTSGAAATLAAWKARVRAHWDGVSIRRVDGGRNRIAFGENLRIEVAARLNGLDPRDLAVELLVMRGAQEEHHALEFSGTLTPAGEHLFALNLVPELCGRLDCRLRAYPRHDLMTHPFELGLMVWA